ncbi:MAG: hypothetical protein IT320_24355 [Anaerolineae bacterium]|nr:hypothetical protein [Anaerolineae bacterium]
MDDFLGLDDAQYWNEPDFLLGLLVSFLANKLNAEFGITLMVRGTVMTGTLVGERAYLGRMNELFKTIARSSLMDPSDEDLNALEEAFGFEDMAEDIYPRDEVNEDEDEDVEADKNASDDMSFPPIRYLHLRDPYILYPGAAMSFTESPLPILRLRLTEVDGWLPGRVNVIDRMDGDFEPPFRSDRFTQ